MANVLIVDDERGLRHSIELALGRLGHSCRSVESGGECLALLETFSPDVILVDIRLPDVDGLELIDRIRAEGTECPIIVLTAYASISNAVAAMKRGAADYLEKPVDLDQLAIVVQRTLENARLRGRLEMFERSAGASTEPPTIIGESEAMRRVMALADRVAAPGLDEASELPTVLLLGETGTGKDLLARYIHLRGPLADQPFVHVNCTALPRELIESELFGHERGAFTDAKSAKRGLLEIAGRGTVFLDEIGDMPLELQAKLLGALEHRYFRRVGGTRARPMDARIIAATNTDLERAVAKGQFRSDLYYRLKVMTIELPPLRARGEDVFLLAEHYLAIYARKYRKKIHGLDESAREQLRRYAWPGNVRELCHVLERAVLLTEEPVVRAEHLGLLPHYVEVRDHGLEGERVVVRDAADAAKTVLEGALVGAKTTDASEDDEPGETLEALERRLIEQALARAGYNVSRAARLVGLSRSAFRRRMARFGITIERHATNRPSGEA